jgi:hypothetical protein
MITQLMAEPSRMQFLKEQLEKIYDKPFNQKIFGMRLKNNNWPKQWWQNGLIVIKMGVLTCN